MIWENKAVTFNEQEGHEALRYFRVNEGWIVK